ncbi:MAG: hypothetical protein FWE21_00525 [Defluviitaleaceae bacterium]|nr:hypothetical protein [Defluviitaleaceae bacterium]
MDKVICTENVQDHGIHFIKGMEYYVASEKDNEIRIFCGKRADVAVPFSKYTAYIDRNCFYDYFERK